jgi:hypothetical protein
MITFTYASLISILFAVFLIGFAVGFWDEATYDGKKYNK